MINTEGSENVRWGGAHSKRDKDEHGTDAGELRLMLGS